MKEVVKDPQKEQRILITSASLFGQHGYRETKTDQIAEEAGVSKGLLFIMEIRGGYIRQRILMLQIFSISELIIRFGRMPLIC